MATGFKLADGRDLSDIFSAGDAGLTVGFQTSNGTDLGRQFMGGSTGVVTGYKDPSGIDLGSRFGNDPWIAQGYAKYSVTVGSYRQTSSGGTHTYYYGAYRPKSLTIYRCGASSPNGLSFYVLTNDSSLGGGRKHLHCYLPNNANASAVAFNGSAYTLNSSGAITNADAFSAVKNAEGTTITVYVK